MWIHRSYRPPVFVLRYRRSIPLADSDTITFSMPYHVPPFGYDNEVEGCVPVPRQLYLRLAEGCTYLLFGMAVAGVVALSPLVSFKIQVAVEPALEHLLDATFLQFLEKTVELVAGPKLL